MVFGLVKLRSHIKVYPDTFLSLIRNLMFRLGVLPLSKIDRAEKPITALVPGLTLRLRVVLNM